MLGRTCSLVRDEVMAQEGRGVDGKAMEKTENTGDIDIYKYRGRGVEKGVEMNARSEETLRNDAWNVPAWDEKVIGRLPGTTRFRHPL